jgi:hypothetical protein
VAISTQEPSAVHTVDQRGPSWPPGSTSQSACLVWHQLGHESRLKPWSALLIVLVYLLLRGPRRRIEKMSPDREIFRLSRHRPRPQLCRGWPATSR